MRSIQASASLGLAGCLVFLAAGAALAGMAELGYKQQLPSPPPLLPDGPAAGNGTVTLTVNGYTFSRQTAPGQLASTVLESLKVQVNLSGTGLVATHLGGSTEISVLAGFAEVASIHMQNTDTALQLISASRMAADATVSLRAVTETPAGGPGQVYVRVNNLSARAVTVPTAGKTAAQVNADIVSGLVANGFTASLAGGEILITHDNLVNGPAQKVYWEDNDTGIRTIKSLALTAPPAAAAPLLSGWALAALAAALAALAAVAARKRATS